MNIDICVGSSCHLKGSYEVIELMKEAVARHQLEDRIILSAAFCLGRCTDGVSVRIDHNEIYSVSQDNFEEFFEKQVLAKL